MMNKKLKKKVGLFLLNIIFIIICCIGLIPILYTVILSFRSGNSALSSHLFGSGGTFTLQNYSKIIMEKPFLNWFANSAILSFGTVLIAMSCSITCAYVFSRYRFKGRIHFLRGLLILNAFPQLLTMFAIFRLFRKVNLINTRIGLIIIFAGSMCIFAILNLKGYFDTIPIEIEEASRIDGASDLQALRKIILPLARPSIIVTSVMILIFVWNEYLFATTFLLEDKMRTLSGGLYQLQANDFSRSWPLFTAAAILVSIPMLIVFFLIQKHMQSGLTAGGVKG